MKRLRPFLLACTLLPLASRAQDKKPNVLIFLSDDQGWGDLSVHGNKNLSTPNIDSLAKDGALFERFFVCPVCAPTRAEFLTGRYHARGGVRGVSTGQERLDLDERTIADTFKAAGYATAAFGKWHNGLQSPYHPNDRGFDEYYGFCSGHWGDYFSPPLMHNNKFVPGNGYTTNDFAEHAMTFIEKNQNRPFFCYVPFNTPHSPMQVPDEYWDRFKNKNLEMLHYRPGEEDINFTRAALAMCENIDWNVGRVLKKLDDLKLADNTIVVYFADNGPNSWRWNDGMKGRKGSVDEGGIRSPLLVRWPKHVPAGTRIPQIAGAIDLLPTLADFCGVRTIGNKKLDGVSLKPLLTSPTPTRSVSEGQSSTWPNRTIVTFYTNRLSLRTQQYRFDAGGGQGKKAVTNTALFDMVKDPGQQHDISKEQPELAAKLAAEAKKWRAELAPKAGPDDRPFTVGYASGPTSSTPLPARDGVAHGTIQRSDSAPNCSFFTHWTSTGDKITWDVDVGRDGRYEATVYYTCRPADVGSTIELSLNGARIETKITEAHDPPLYGKEHDRVERKAESFMKDFKPLKLGAFDLKTGRGDLTLRALKIPGQQVIDVRYIILDRIQNE
ncbi:MAG TPA: arylsulfatase [Pirellulaceae bacterium]